MREGYEVKNETRHYDSILLSKYSKKLERELSDLDSRERDLDNRYARAKSTFDAALSKLQYMRSNIEAITPRDERDLGFASGGLESALDDLRRL